MAVTPPPLKALTVAAALCLSLLCGPASAQWMWRSADGRVNASDRPPPPGVAEKDIIRRPAADNRRQMNAKGDKAAAPADAASAPPLAASAVARAASAPPTALEREALARKQAAEKEKADKAKTEEDRQAAQRASNCRGARSQVASLESGLRVVRTNEKGEREVLDDRSRADELRRAREAITSDCR
jgi:hypothetical protein